jgi:hypothetical protein
MMILTCSCNRISLGKFWRPAVDHRRFYAWSVKPVSTLSAWSTSQKHSGRLIMRVLNKTFVVNSWWSFFTPLVDSIYVLQRKLDMMSWSCVFERITWVLKVMCLQAAAAASLPRVHQWSHDACMNLTQTSMVLLDNPFFGNDLQLGYQGLRIRNSVEDLESSADL